MGMKTSSSKIQTQSGNIPYHYTRHVPKPVPKEHTKAVQAEIAKKVPRGGRH